MASLETNLWLNTIPYFLIFAKNLRTRLLRSSKKPINPQKLEPSEFHKRPKECCGV